MRELCLFVTLVAVALGVGILTAGPAFEDALRCFLATLLAIETVAALYAVADTWLQNSGENRGRVDQRSLDPSIRGFSWTWFPAIVVGTVFLVLGGIGILIFVDNNLTMDTQGASLNDWIHGSPLILATCIGSFARGAAIVGFMALLLDGESLGRSWAIAFGVCAGSLLSLLVWRLSGDPRSIVAGTTSLLLLVTCLALAIYVVGRGRHFATRSRRWGAFGFLAGLAMGLLGAILPSIAWALFWKPPTLYVLSALLASGIGAIVGMLFGAEPE